jgi:uncharacterized protein YidB (DUF937 family)
MSTAIQQANPGMSADRATSVATAIATRTPQAGTAGASGATDQAAAASAFGATQAAGASATHGHHHRHHAMAVGMQAAAQTLGVSTDELTSSLRSGQSLTSLASSKGVSQDDLITAISAALQQSDTSLSSDQASQIATRIATSTPESQPWAASGSNATSTFGVTA